MKSAITEIAQSQHVAPRKFLQSGNHLRHFDTPERFSSYSPKFFALQHKPEKNFATKLF